MSTIKYGLWQLAASGMKVLPRWVPSPEAIAAGLESKYEHRARTTCSLFREMSASKLDSLREVCRARGLTVSAALCAAAVLGAADAMGEVQEEGEEDAGGPEVERYKLLQAVDMRTLRFKAGEMDLLGARDDWSGGTVLAGTGSLDLLLDLPAYAGEAVRAVRVMWRETCRLT